MSLQLPYDRISMELPIMRILKTIVFAAAAGFITGLLSVAAQRLLSADMVFSLGEAAMVLIIPCVTAVTLAWLGRVKVVLLIAVAYLTLFIPVLGPAFGGTGSEPLIAFAALGLAGGIFWSLPFVLFTVVFNRKW